MRKAIYLLLAGSLLSGCASALKKGDYQEFDCGHSWVYKIQNDAVPIVDRVLYLKGESGAPEEEKIRKSLERLLVIDENRDLTITKEEAEKYEGVALQQLQEKLQKQDQKTDNSASLKELLQSK